MDYLKLQWPYVTSPTWRLASAAARGAAVSLLGYCFRAETSGRIVGCRSWSREQWRAAADLSPRDVEVAVSAGLARWNEQDLLVEGYDTRGQESLEIQRMQGHHGKAGASHGQLGGRPRIHPKGDKEKPPKGVIQKPPEGDTSKPPQYNPIQSNPGEGERVGAHDPTAPADAVEPPTPRRDGLEFILASHGLRTHGDALGQWEALLTGPLVGADFSDRSLAEALKRLLDRARQRGVTVRYAPDVAEIASQMAEERRQRAVSKPQVARKPEVPQEIQEEARKRRLAGNLNPMEAQLVNIGRRHVDAVGDLAPGRAPVAEVVS